ncbi:MAG: tRNA (adenosine(37)-N6)-threonylcarbamoyltransferase complex ATPase subunit type 1 TsaE [Calditrichaeota bacterium]|nr:MAG: tRNA (adenosine(37)-N6)-threonylcarbamoyltransferase complex ATPase subunit type 1 TsaE [Calditrichota bacterium]
MPETIKKLQHSLWLPRRKVTSPQATAAIAERFARVLRPGDVVACYGNLGAGKTFFIAQVCRALGVEEPVTSPTFTLLNVYRGTGKLPVYHFDFYRIEHESELEQLGLEDFFFGDGVAFIEWPERVESFLPARRYQVHLELVPGEPEARIITIQKRNDG